MHFHPPAKAILACLPAGCQLKLEREPSNQFDSNAIKVLVATSAIPEISHPNLDAMATGYGFPLADILAQEEWWLGFIGRDFAASLAPILDSGKQSITTLAFSPEGKPVGMVEIQD